MKYRSKMKDDRTKHFHMIPLVLACVLLSTYGLGMWSIYFKRGEEAAKSLSIGFDYDSDKVAEYNYLTNVNATIDKLLNLAENKDGSLDAVIYKAGLPDANLAKVAAENIRSEISFVYKQGEEAYREQKNCDALIRSLYEEIETVEAFQKIISEAMGSADRKEKKVLEALDSSCSKLVNAFWRFSDLSGEGPEVLMEEGNLNSVSEYARALQTSLKSLSDIEQEAADYFYEAPDRMLSKSDEICQGILSLADKLSKLTDMGEDGLILKVRDNGAIKSLQSLINDRLKENGEDSISRDAFVVEDNSINYDLRKRLSRDAKENGRLLSEKVDSITYELLSESYVGTITSADGKLLFSALPDSGDYGTKAYDNLIGSASLSSLSDSRNFSRLIIDCYKEELYSDMEYSPFKGFLAGESAEIDLTIRASLQESMYQYMADHNVEGEVLCVDYSTGETLCMASTEAYNMSLRNTSPGSTMKIVTLFLLEASGVDSEKVIYTCDGKYGSIKCTSGDKVLTHGTINGITAVGESCNCWFAQAIENHLMKNGVVKEAVCEILSDLGYQVTDDVNVKTELKKIGKVNRDKSVINFDADSKATSLWNLIGETTVEMSPIDMVELVALLNGAGNAKKTYLVKQEGTTAIDLSDKYGTAFKAALDIWKQGFSERSAYEIKNGVRADYTYSNLSESITAAKTGTTQLNNNNDQQRLLLGFSEEKQAAFYIIIHNYRVGGEKVKGQDVTVADIANYLFEQLAGEER